MNKKQANKIIRDVMLNLIKENPGKYDEDYLTEEVVKISLTNPVVKEALDIENQETWKRKNK